MTLNDLKRRNSPYFAFLADLFYFAALLSAAFATRECLSVRHTREPHTT